MAYIVTGLDAIINPDNVRPGVNIKDLELMMVSKGMIAKPDNSVSAQDKFTEEIMSTANRLGISFNDVIKPKTQETPQLPNLQSDTSLNTQINTSVVYDSDSDDEPVHLNNANTHSYGNVTHSDTHSDAYNDTRNDAYSNDTYSNTYSNTYSDSRSDTRGDMTELQTRTQEQERRNHINAIVGSSASNDISFEKEKRDDLKCYMISEIFSLRETLEQDGVDLSHIPVIDKSSNYEDVETVLKILRHKNDTSRYCGFAEEFIMFLVYGVEEICDGKKTYFDTYRPDLTGWHNTVNMKLKRMRTDTSQIVSSTMQVANIGPVARILLELLPNMVLYSKMRSQQHGEQGIFSDDEIMQRKQNIRNNN